MNSPLFSSTYVSPVAQHVIEPERLIVRGGDDRYYLWFGQEWSDGLEDIPQALAHWMIEQPMIEPVLDECWVHVDDLPTAPASATGGR